jgi:hypothetical protein
MAGASEVPGSSHSPVLRHRKAHAAQRLQNARPKAVPYDGLLPLGHWRVRRDVVGKMGKLTLRYASRVYHIGIGRPYAGTPVLLLVHDLDVRVITEDGELLPAADLGPDAGLPAARGVKYVARQARTKSRDCDTSGGRGITAIPATDDPRWPTAVHEAGHAVAARALGRGVRSVTITPDADAFGRARHYPLRAFQPDHGVDGRVRWRIEQAIMISMAGVAAQGRVSDDAERIESGSQSDRETAVNLALFVSRGEPDEAQAYVKWLGLRVGNLLAEPVWWAGVERLARELLLRGTMSGRDVNAAIQDGIDHLLTPRRSSPPP